MNLKHLRPRVSTLGNRLPTIQPGSWRTSSQTSGQRGYDYKWQKARESYLRLNPFCVKCDTEGIVTMGNTVDHKVPHRGDRALFWDKSNWQTLCGPHHSSDKQREENAAAGA